MTIRKVKVWAVSDEASGSATKRGEEGFHQRVKACEGIRGILAALCIGRSSWWQIRVFHLLWLMLLPRQNAELCKVALLDSISHE